MMLPLAEEKAAQYMNKKLLASENDFWAWKNRISTNECVIFKPRTYPIVAVWYIDPDTYLHCTFVMPGDFVRHATAG